MTLLQLFWCFIQVGLLSVGGGYAAVPLIEDQVVAQYGWMSVPEFADMVTIAGMMPGSIAINSATFVGTRVAGFPGALAATVGCVLPSLAVVSLLAALYGKYRDMTVMRGALAGLRPAVVALIASAGLSILANAFFSGPNGAVSILAAAIFAGAFAALRKLKPNPILVMALCGALFLLIGALFPGLA